MGGLDGMLASTHPWGIRGRLHISVRQLAGAISKLSCTSTVKHLAKTLNTEIVYLCGGGRSCISTIRKFVESIDKVAHLTGRGSLGPKELLVKTASPRVGGKLHINFQVVTHRLLDSCSKREINCTKNQQ